jgi:CRP-like cAMP-binding protein
MMNDSIVEMLQKTPLWAGLTSQDLGLVAKYAEARSFESGQKIVTKGDPETGFCLLLEGAAEVRSGSETLSKLGPGQFFGEMAIFDNQPRSADVVAIEQSKVLTLSANAFKTLLFANPKIAFRMLQELARRLRTTNEHLSD